MLHLFTGTDRQKARGALHAAAEKMAVGATPLRITDAHAFADLDAALRGGGMFAQSRVVVLDGVLSNQDMRDTLLAALPWLAASPDPFYMYEEKPDAATRKQLEKHAARAERFDLPSARGGGTSVFALADAMNRGDKKNLWIGYHRELAAGGAPEAIHGVLFWGAKKALLSARTDAARAKAARLLAQLAELPHESRREGEDMEYALERFMLGVA